MKKIYLTVVSLIISGALTAQIKVDPSKVVVNNQVAEKTNGIILNEQKSDPNAVSKPSSNQGRPVDRRAINYEYIKVGSTKYDLQSNASMGRRIILHADGTVTTVFTTSTNNSFTNRGTGYNYFNGTSWVNDRDNLTQRLETSRTGWPSIGVLGNKEFVMGHVAETGGFVLSKNNGIGQKDFPDQKTVLLEGNDRPIWGRIASDGQNYIHVICNYSDSSSTQPTPAPTIKGVRAPMMYARSQDGGDSWDAFGEITVFGSNFTNGTYTNIPVLNSGTKKKVLASFTCANGSVVSFKHNENPNEFAIGDVLTIRGRVANIVANIEGGNDTVRLPQANYPIINGSDILGNVSGLLDANTLITEVLDDSTFVVSPTPLMTGVDTLTITPPYGNGRFFTFTFQRQMTLLPGFDSTRWLSGSADRYAIDVKDSVVAIVTGGLGTDVMMWKSIDNGATFTPIIIDSFPYAPFDGTQLATDTPFCSDGTFSIIIDQDNKCHVWYGIGRIFNDNVLESTYNFYPATAGLAYWNESLAEARVIANGSMFDRDGDGVLGVEAGTFSGLASGNIPQGLFSVARLTNTSLIRQPSAGIDDQGRMFVTFSVPDELEIDPNALNYRDIFIMHSVDGGESWRGPQNVTQARRKECDFASIARDVNGFVHILLQEDDIPGNNLTNNNASANNHPIAEEGNDMMYAAIPVSEILDSTIGNLWMVNVKEINNPSKVFVVSQNAPNPFSNETNVTIYLNQYTQDLNVSIIDIMGKKLFDNNIKNLAPGNHVLTIDGSNYSSGIYFYTITAGANSVTRKMIVE